MDRAMVRPFAQGTEFLDWWNLNCGNCHKSSEGQGTCFLEDAIYDGMITGEIAKTTADRIGQEDHCKEIEWIRTPDATPAIPGLDTITKGAR